MKENIEEEIGRIENILSRETNFKKNRRGNKEIRFEINSSFYNNLKFFLSDYKRVLKKNEQLQTEVNSLKKDISNMYEEEVIISIISDNFNFSRNKVLKLLGGE